MGYIKKPVVGLSFTSRNRPDLLEICLCQTLKYLSPRKFDYVISVVNDIGDAKWNDYYEELKIKFPDVVWYQPAKRLGIARAKNEGIKILRKDCNHFFLADDDAFPIKKGWEQLFIDIAAQNDVGHLMHQFPIKDRFELIASENGICKYIGCCGAFLYFTRHAIDTIGGMRKDFEIYANEHNEIALRAHAANLQGKWGPFMAPKKSRDYIYSIDLELTTFGIQPKDLFIDPKQTRSSVAGENLSLHGEHNMRVFQRTVPYLEQI